MRYNVLRAFILLIWASCGLLAGIMTAYTPMSKPQAHITTLPRLAPSLHPGNSILVKPNQLEPMDLASNLGASVPLLQAGDCKLRVPARALTSLGLATPWELLPPCHENDPNAAVFVQAVIYDKDARSLSTYAPLVIDAGTRPVVAPVLPVLPAHSVVALWGGGNDNRTFLVGHDEQCTNGAAGRVFGQVFFCNTGAFWQAVNSLGVVVPPLGIGSDGRTCPSVRSFAIVDQDQSDNVQVTYLVLPDGRTMQNNATNRLAFPGAAVIKNPSDNRVLSDFVDPALSCSSWAIPDIGDNGTLEPTQATNELQAAFQSSPVALIPLGDPMTGPNVLAMVNAYRAGVNQPLALTRAQASTAVYCEHLRDIAPTFIEAHKVLFSAFPSPVPSIGANLYLFLKARLAASFMLLHCSKE